MNKPPFKKGTNNSQPNMNIEEENFDLIKEFAENSTAYDIHYYNNAIFAVKDLKKN